MQQHSRPHHAGRRNAFESSMGAAKWEQHGAKWRTISCVLEAYMHASIGNGNVIIPAVGLLELLDVLQLLGERHEHLD